MIKEILLSEGNDTTQDDGEHNTTEFMSVNLKKANTREPTTLLKRDNSNITKVSMRKSIF